MDKVALSIAGVVLEETTEDEIGDIPIPAVLIPLLDEDSNAIATTLPGTDGSFLFEDLTPGT